MPKSRLLLGLVFVGGVCLAQDLAELEVDHRVQAEFVTPHTDWAVPYALGKTRVLFFLRGHGTEPREAVELQQRFDLESQMVFWTRIIDSTQEHWHGDERGIQRMTRLVNLAMAGFPALSAERTPQTAAGLLRQVLGQGGVSPPLGLTGAVGPRLRNVEITRWLNGPVQITEKGPTLRSLCFLLFDDLDSFERPPHGVPVRCCVS